MRMGRRSKLRLLLTSFSYSTSDIGTMAPAGEGADHDAMSSQCRSLKPAAEIASSALARSSGFILSTSMATSPSERKQ